MDWTIIIIVGIIIIGLIIFTIVRNKKDEKEFEQKVNNDFINEKNKPKDAETGDNMV